MIGITPIQRKNKEVYQVAFSFRGVQCRELVDLPHNRANEQYCQRLRAEIQGKIARGDFNYGDYFPQSPRAAIFGQGVARTKKLGPALKAYRERVQKTLEPSSFDGYRKAIDHHLIPWCGEMHVGELKPSDIRDWVSLQTVKLKTIRNRLIPLRVVLDEAVGDQLIPFNPLDKVKLDKLVPVDKRTSDFEPEPYTVAELVTLLDALPDPYERWTFQLWAFTGLRTGELVGLRWARVDLGANGFEVRETTTSRKDKARPKTKAGIRWVPMLPAAREAIDAMRALTQTAGDRVFVNERSTRKDRAWDEKRLAQVWRRAHKGTGIKYRNPYQLRHTFASQLLSQGENLAYISKLLGHKTVEMAQRTYARWISEGEKLGFDRPPREYGMALLADAAAREKRVKNA